MNKIMRISIVMLLALVSAAMSCSEQEEAVDSLESGIEEAQMNSDQQTIDATLQTNDVITENDEMTEEISDAVLENVDDFGDKEMDAAMSELENSGVEGIVDEAMETVDGLTEEEIKQKAMEKLNLNR